MSSEALTLIGALVTGLLALAGILAKIWADRHRTEAEVEKVRAEVEELTVRVSHDALSMVSNALSTAQAASDAEKERTDAVIEAMRAEVGEVRSTANALEARLDHMVTKHSVAVTHIARREVWTYKRWPDSRPDDLDPVPEELRADVITVEPVLASVLGVDEVSVRTNDVRLRSNTPMRETIGIDEGTPIIEVETIAEVGPDDDLIDVTVTAIETDDDDEPA